MVTYSILLVINAINLEAQIHQILNFLRDFVFHSIIDEKSYWFKSTNKKPCNLKKFYKITRSQKS